MVLTWYIGQGYLHVTISKIILHYKTTIEVKFFLFYNLSYKRCLTCLAKKKNKSFFFFFDAIQREIKNKSYTNAGLY